MTTPVADRTYAVRGEPVGGAAVFRAGQWSSVSVPRWSAPLWSGSRRVFSFVSAPGQQPVEFGFTVAAALSTYKAALVDGSVRRVYVDEIGGDFVLPRSFPATGSVVLIASGIGITPFVSMVRELVQSGHDLSGLTIAHVLRDQRRAVHADDLERARAANARIATVEAPELADGIDDPARLADRGPEGVLGFGLSNDERRGSTPDFAPAFRIAERAGLMLVPHSGELLGPDTPVRLRMLEITPALKAAEGTAMELSDSAMPLLRTVNVSTDQRHRP